MAKNTHAQEAATGTPDSYTAEESTGVEGPAQVLITRPSLVDEPPVMVRDESEVQKTPLPVVVEEEFYEDEEESSQAMEDGGDFTQSSPNEHNESGKQSRSPQPLAPTTDSLSSQTALADSDVHSTDGDGHLTDPQPSASTTTSKATPVKKTTAKKSSTVSKQRTMAGAEDEFDEFSS